MRVDHVQEVGDDSQIKRLLQVGGAQEVPRMNHQINEAEPWEGIGRDLTARTCNGLFRCGRGERIPLTS
jgi:hypothetical protein